MLGNDVVDLALATAQSNWRRKGFLEKIFSPEEQEFIKDSFDKNEMVWLLWSMKEAAYKAHQRRFNLPRRLNWIAQRCSGLELTSEEASGVVEIEDSVYKTTSEVNRNYIHTIAQILPKIPLKNVILETSSAAVKKKLLEQIARDYSTDLSEVTIQKNREGVPYILVKNVILATCFSLSGHGRFSGFSLAVNDV